MSAHPRPRRKQEATASPDNSRYQKNPQEALQELQDTVRHGVAVETLLWTFNTRDWVTNVQAADIDDDGDVEVLVASRDGYVRALTRWGAVKWEQLLEGHSIKTMSVVPSRKTVVENRASIIIGTRSGKVFALNKSGERLPHWEYATDRMIRQVYISPQAPDSVVIGSEDHCIHVLDSATGKPRWEKYQTGDLVRCVFAGDIDGDGRIEFLGGSGDGYLYILNDQGHCLDKFHLGYQCIALFAAPLYSGGPIHILTSSNHKELTVWAVSRRGKQWKYRRAWEKLSSENIFENRIHSIYVEDINNDNHPEILLGSEDGHLYILDRQGEPLWKRHFESCINSLYASDINFDGQVEILAGTEDTGASVLHLEFSDSIYQRIGTAYRNARGVYEDNEIIKALSFRERMLLLDFITERSTPRPPRTQMEVALRLMEEKDYEKALSLFLRLLRQRVQFYWSQPIETKGYIWAECFGDIATDSIQKLLVGTDEGYVYALDIEKNTHQRLWERDLGARVLTLLATRFFPDEFDSIVALLANHQLVILNHLGEIVKEHTFENEQDWVRDIAIYKSSENQDSTTSKIVIGQENNQISIWDASLQQPITTIETSQGINVVYIYDITGNGTGEIISGSIGNQVYAHTWQGKELWCFETTSFVQALCIKDIDRDGYAEIIVGSEDCYVYVLSHDGHLKWRYRTERSVMAIDVCDVKLENDPDEESVRTWKILVGSADTSLYVLNADGDLLWKYKNKHSIHIVRARDVNQDGILEIALASEKQLEVLQILNWKELFEYAQYCWRQLLDPHDDRSSIISLTYHQDEYIRAFALAKLAGQHVRHDGDFKRFHDALREETSLQAKRELVRSIVVLCGVPYHHEENMRQARQLLQQLYTDPAEEIKLAIVDILPNLIEIEERLCFEYFERFTDNIDIRVRRTVVRLLDKLVKRYTVAVFALLKKTARDEDAWVRQETGRVLAHYFDAHQELLVRDALALLYTGADPVLLQQIAFSAVTPSVKQIFHILVKLLTQLDEENITDLLNEAISTIGEVDTPNLLYGNVLLALFEEFRLLFHVKTVSDIAHYRPVISSDVISGVQVVIVTRITGAFAALQQVVQIVKAYERREAIGDRVTSLLNALEALDKIRADMHRVGMRRTRKIGDVYRVLEDSILYPLLDQWYKIVKRELYNLRGDAQLIAYLGNTVVQREAEVAISLNISNAGRSPAEHVQVELEESNDFDIVGSGQCTLTEVSSSKPVSINFFIKPHVATPRLSFRLTYDDAERKARRELFADIVTIQECQRLYRFIPNPYTSGTPIRDEGMFFGREEDRAILREKLSSVGVNKVVVLSGQRRVGKTSLLYQLAKDLSNGPYAPVFIDLQAISPVTDVGQLLMSFASSISNEVQNYKGVYIPTPNHQAFLSNPTAIFGDFLTQVLQQLSGCRLVFLLDEFERLHDVINKGILDHGILHYLRSLMQHRQNLSFLISGAPRTMRPLTEPSWSVFFNIALFHQLTRLRPDEAVDLITRPISEYLDYDQLALERVRALTGDQPYLIHILSEKLIAHCNKQKKSYITINDVNTILDILLEEQISSIEWIWKQSSPPERFILSILAQEKGQEGRVFTLNDIGDEYSNQNVAYAEKGVAEALQNLVKDDIVEERFHGTQFRIPIGLMKEWLRRAKPPGRVGREEQLH